MRKNQPVTKAVARVEAKAVAKIVDAESIFAEFLHLDVATGKASPKTIRNYKAGVKSFLVWCKSQGVNPAACTNQDVKRYREFLIAQGFKPATIALKLTCVRRFFDSLVESGGLAFNPAKMVVAPKDKEARENKVKYLPETVVISLLNGVNTSTDKGKRDKAILALMALHGLRACEISGLLKSDVDLGVGTVQILGKGGKLRTVYLTEKTKSILQAWLDVAGNSDFVFSNFHHDRTKGGHLTTAGLWEIVKHYLLLLGISKHGISCHSLRHSAATLSLARGASLESIRDMLGHSSVVTTEVYARVLEREKNNPALFLDSLLS